MNILDATIQALSGKLEESKELKNESVLSDIYQELDDSREITDVEGLIDDVLVITDPDVSSEEYEEIIEKANEIVEDTPEGNIPFDDRYVGQYLLTCPICGSSFVHDSILDPGASCPICCDQPEAFIVVGKVETDEVIAQQEGIEVETDEDVESESNIETVEETPVETEENTDELEKDVASVQLNGNKLTENKLEESIDEEDNLYTDEASKVYTYIQEKMTDEQREELFSKHCGELSTMDEFWDWIEMLDSDELEEIGVELNISTELEYEADKELDLKRTLAESVEIPKELSALYDYIFTECEIDRQGNIAYMPEYDNIINYYDDTITEEQYNKCVSDIETLIKNAKFYSDDGQVYIELNDNHTLNDINRAIDDLEYVETIYRYHEMFEEETGESFYNLGRSGRHICVDLTLENLLKYDELKATQEKFEQAFIKDLNSGETIEESKEVKTESRENDIETRINQAKEWKQKVENAVEAEDLEAIVNEIIEATEDIKDINFAGEDLNSGMESVLDNGDAEARGPVTYVKSVKRDMQNILDDFIDNYEQAFEEESLEESVKVEESIDIEDDNTADDKIMPYMVFKYKDHYIEVDDINDDDESVWNVQVYKSIEDLENGNSIASAGINGEDFVANIHEYIDEFILEESKPLTEELNKDDFEKDIEDLLNFLGNTDDVATKEAEAIYMKLYEIVEQEAEKINPLKESVELNESKTLDDFIEEHREDIEEEYNKVKAEELGIDVETFISQDNAIDEKTFNEVAESMFNGRELNESENDNPMLSVREENTDVFVSKNSYGYNVIGLIIDNENKQFQIVDGQALPIGKYTKTSTKKIYEKAEELIDDGYEKYTGKHSIVGR